VTGTTRSTGVTGSAVTVAPGTVTDTTTGAGFVPVTVTARLAEPVVRLPTNPLLLDGPLSWCAAMAALQAGRPVPPVVRDGWTEDLALPLATWTAPAPGGGLDERLYAADGAGVWGWACSRARYTPDLHTAVQVRRKPAVAEFGRFTTDRRFHAALGPQKARDQAHPATVTRTIRWDALADPGPLRDLLTHLGHLGALTRHGHGRILSITVEETTGETTGRDGWRDRPMPHPGGRPEAIRAPYWHHTRRVPCTDPATDLADHPAGERGVS
jgi:hypothetical protein